MALMCVYTVKEIQHRQGSCELGAPDLKGPLVSRSLDNVASSKYVQRYNCP